MNQRKTILVAGSLNADFVATVERLPAPGETVLSSGFQMVPGGKGANQANAAGRLGGDVVMAGCIGDDVFGGVLVENLEASGVHTNEVVRVEGLATGVALIGVDKSGQNSIIVASGANARFGGEQASRLKARLAECAWLLLQLESPLETVSALAKLASDGGCKVMLDPAPAQVLSRELLNCIDVLTPNESEACLLLGEAPRELSVDETPAMAARLRSLGAKAVVMKMGAQGCLYQSSSETIVVPGFAVKAVDTTAAGDTFNAGLAVALAEGLEMPQALRMANAAAALSVTKLGAQASAPWRAEVNALLIIQ